MKRPYRLLNTVKTGYALIWLRRTSILHHMRQIDIASSKRLAKALIYLGIIPYKGKYIPTKPTCETIEIKDVFNKQYNCIPFLSITSER